MRRRYSRDIQLSVFLSGMIALMAVAGAVVSYRQAIRANAKMASEATGFLLLTLRAQHLVERSFASSRSFVLVGDESFAQDMELSRAELLRVLGALSGAGGEYGSRLDKIEAIESRLHALHRKAHDMRRNGRPARAVGLFLVEHVKPVRERLDAQVSQLMRLSEAELRDAAAEAKANVTYARRVSVAGGLAVLITFLIVLRLVRGLTAAQLETERSVRELNASLESRVAERTRELLASNRELETFSYSVAHDLRTPLRAITNYGDMVLTQLKDSSDERLKERIDRIRAAGVRMSDLIDALLALSRLTRRPYSPERVDLSALAAEVAEEIAEAYPDRRVKITIEPGLHDLGDASMLRVLFRNLLENAWKFTAKTPAAAVEVGRTTVEEGLAYFVRDNGVGFDPRFQSKILMPFERLHDAPEYPGSGIGLPTVDRVVRKHGGTLWAEGKINEGAAFFFTLNRRISTKERLMTPENFRDT